MKELITAAMVAERMIGRLLEMKFELTYPQFRALQLLAARGGTANMGELAGEMGCSRGNMTGIGDRLERDGWVARERGTVDRRAVTVQLVRDIRPVEAFVDQYSAELPPEVHAYLNGLVAQLEAVSAAV